VTNALILGAGGPAAAAFEIGIIAGLADGGLDVRDADLMIGTSAGARVAVQLAGPAAHDALFDHMVTPVSTRATVADLKTWGQRITEIKQRGGTATQILQRMGELALSVTPGADRRAEVARQLDANAWPARRLLVVAVECESGERRAFDRASGAALVDAVAASGTLPGVAAAIEIDGRHYMDGGMYSTDNADLAAGCDRVLVIGLRAGNPRLPLVGLDDTTRGLARVEIIQPDDAAQAALAAVGGNVLDPAVAPAMARAARTQGQQAARQIAAFWRGRE
jgi:NTE family protein